MPRLTVTQKVDLLLKHLQRTDRVLSGLPVRCQISNALSAPGWSTGNDVYVNADPTFIPQLDTMADYATVTGVNYHELGHVISTPTVQQLRTVAAVANRRKELGSLRRDWQTSFNILEDQRQEAILVRLWPSMRHYLTVAVLRHCISDASMAHIYTYGRRYLPKEVRKTMRLSFGPMKAARRTFERYIDAYRTLDLLDPHDFQDALVIIQEFDHLYRTYFGTIPPKMCTDGIGSAEGDARNSKVDIKAAIEQIKAESSGAESEGSDTDEDADGGKPSSAENLKQVDQAISDMLQDGNLNQDMSEAIQSVEHGAGAPSTAIHEQFSLLPAASSSVAKVQEVVRHLRLVEQDVDPGWEHYHDQGRLNVRRAMGRSPFDRGLFDQWEPGKAQANSFEIVVLLDRSYSMDGHIHQANQMAWVLKRAGDLVKANTTVIAYGSYHTTLYRADEPAKADKIHFTGAGGGTWSGDALVDAMHIFARSRRPNKLLLMMTDGAWTNGAYWKASPPAGVITSDGMVEHINNMGVLTALLNFYPNSVPDSQLGWHNAQIRARGATVGKLPELFKKIVAEMMRKGK